MLSLYIDKEQEAVNMSKKDEMLDIMFRERLKRDFIDSIKSDRTHRKVLELLQEFVSEEQSYILMYEIIRVYSTELYVDTIDDSEL